MSESVHLLIKDRNKGPLKLKETFKLPSSFQTKAANPLYFILLDHKTKQEEQKIKSIVIELTYIRNITLMLLIIPLGNCKTNSFHPILN